ncbi:hypothetical protein PR202_gb26055 [Eleusine coracana subsp. coracana]|uniref:F-box domain-containing protein n=1 Tax=Eleusine coracana subsp. coracana TaxID=191504 RepID=A0AAV5FQV2_ELECO|nr:hypothetical protein PR202_gb26055 [Eleusine coracana subsp. coracana]
MPRIKRRRAAAAGADRLSDLPDDLLRLILRRLDTRTALSTAVLARRWARLSLDLPVLDIRVGDVLPPRYHRALAVRRGCDPARTTAVAAVRELDAVVTQCERRVMRAFADGVTGLMTAADDVEDRRRVKTLRVEFFPFTMEEESDSCVVDCLIPTAIAAWGVEDLEVVARPLHLDDLHVGPAYTFPHHCLDDDLHRSRLRSLTLANCTVPPLHRCGALVLSDMPASTPMATYRGLFTSNSPLQSLRLKSCRCARDELVISAPGGSRLRELVVDGCSFREIHLRDLPSLERLACLTSPHDELGCFLEGAPPTVASLVVRLTGPSRWITPRPLGMKLHGLTRLLVADVPASWDVTCVPRLLLHAAPSLQVLHIHVATPDRNEEPPGHEVSWPVRSRFRHRHLREIVLAGFGRTWRQVFFVRYLARVCKALERVVLLENWCAREKGLWDWDLVRQRECPWTEEDKMS